MTRAKKNGANSARSNPSPEYDNRIRIPSNIATKPIVTESPTDSIHTASKKRKRTGNGPSLKVIPLGGLGEIGKNMTVFEYANDMIIIDCGVAFPEEDMPGIDAVIQDFSYVINNKHKLRGIFLTHGHEDHIGALPYLFHEIKCPVYGGRLTIELVRRKLAEKGGLKGIALHDCLAGDVIKLCSSFEIEFIRVNHSIADAFAIAVNTPLGSIIHTGDFKIDYTPINGEPIDLQRLADYGHRKVLLLLAESTNVEIPGVSPSEMQVGESFQRIFKNAPGRIIVATFSSHVHRMQQIFTAAELHRRKVALIGRSMLNVFSTANSLDYIKMQPETLIDISEIDKYQPNEVVILTTGSQAEPLSALSRMAFASHRIVEIHQGDTVILSAHPIPGNEKPIYRVINELFRRGAHVIYESLADVHVSGHAYRNELMLIHQLVKPKYFIPVHGEYRMMYRHAELAKTLGQPESDIFLLNNGDVLEIDRSHASVKGYVNAAPVLIDGSGVGDLDNRVLRDRKLLADDGVVSVAIVSSKSNGTLLSEPKIDSIGFLYESEANQVLDECQDKLVTFFEKCARQGRSLPTVVESGQLRDYLKSFFFDRTKRRPMIIISISSI
ncbi:MAG: ribonuclease J [Clostridiaceae bacterium]|nr:ribonuclease J [Clostridiaceae bacterium]